MVTAGPTFEPIDPVRGITNLSSGKTGFALARAAARPAPMSRSSPARHLLPTPRHVRRIDVRSAGEMYDAVHAHLPADVFIAVAAVADWHVANASASKIKKQAGAAPPALQFTANPRHPRERGCAVEAAVLCRFRCRKRKRPGERSGQADFEKVPLIVANRAQDALGADASELHLVDSSGITTLPRADKREQARRLIAAIAERL